MSARFNPIELELYTNRFAAVVREMGEMLRRTALSTNVKERLDFSCALLDPDGELVVNAPHIPVHLGALGMCARSVFARLEPAPGDVIVTNHPAFGGSHLPDITVLTPVFEIDGAKDDSGELLGFVASRAHHSELGGASPGSMPPRATRLAQEGVVIEPMRLIERGAPRWDAMRALLLSGPHPTRAVEENLADLRAAVAANRRGAEALRRMAAEIDGSGGDKDHEASGESAACVLRGYMDALKSRAEQRIRRALARRPEGEYEATQRLDDGAEIRVRIEVRHNTLVELDDASNASEGDVGGSARIDFSGTSSTHPGNLNATPAIVHSAVIYVLRLMLSEAAARESEDGGDLSSGSMPLNEGLMRAVEVVLPEGTMLNPNFQRDGAMLPSEECPAVVGGNVETSQRVVDALIQAFGLAAGSQGTMNNVLFGSDKFGYYETVGGGAGAGPTWDGASGVHTHMTNTRITDPEILEHRYPVRLERFALRRTRDALETPSGEAADNPSGSGGAGERRGGDGLVREIRFLEPVELSVLTQHRIEGPDGAQGGERGAPGRQRVLRANGDSEELNSVDGRSLQPGDRLLLETPGGGGWGKPPHKEMDEEKD